MQSQQTPTWMVVTRRVAGDVRCAVGVAALWAVVFLLAVMAWLPAMHARTHALEHASGVCATSHAACEHSHGAGEGGVTRGAKKASLPADPSDCDICAQLLLALVCGAVPTLDPPMAGAMVAARVEITRESVSARELAHLPPSRGPPVM